MQLNQLEELSIFKLRDKFSVEAWNERGLMPTGEEICKELSLLFNQTADKLIEAIKARKNSKQIKILLGKHLIQFNSNKYDTEEREFIADLFFELTSMVNVEFKNEIEEWLYGKTVNKFTNIFKQDKGVIEAISQKCDNCNINIESFVIQKEEGIPEHDWMIIQCNRCKSYNLLNIGPNIKQFRFGDYKLIECLSKKEYTIDQASARLEQIKGFRQN